MIYLNKEIKHEDLFIELLEKTKNIALKKLTTYKSVPSSDAFETLAYESMTTAAKGSLFDGHVKRTGPHGFPDIIAKKYFGAEVKMTDKNKWTSLGNSALESTRDEDVEKIYLFFGKLGGGADIKFRRYQDCMIDIAVTHSPRYRINMDLPAGESIFDKMGIPYDELRADNPLRQFKKYYISQLEEGEELWWIDQQEEETSVSPIIKQFRNLDSALKVKFITETFCLFPEILGSSSLKFERVAAYLITHFNAVSPSLRDYFTAGGQELITIKKKNYKVPQIYKHLFEVSKNIKHYLAEVKKGELGYYWRSKKIKGENIDEWKKIIDKAASDLPKGIKASDIFEAGLA